MSAPDLPERLGTARHEATSSDETVTASVDGMGRLLALGLQPKAMRLPAERLAAAITETVQTAQNQARAALREAVPSVPATGELAGLAELATSLQSAATERLSEITAALDRLNRSGPGGPRP